MMHTTIEGSALPKSINLSELKPGDVICFLPQTKTTVVKQGAQNAISFFQSFQSDEPEHTKTVHCAIHVGDGYIAHMNKRGYILCQIGDPNYPDYSLSRPFNIYRPINQKAADRLAIFAFIQEELRSHFSYSYNSIIKTIWVDKNKIDPNKPIKKNKKKLPSEMMCSEFTIRAMKKAWTNHQNEKIEGFPYPHIRSVVSPKILEDYLSTHPGFVKMAYLGSHSFKTFFNLVLGETAYLVLEKSFKKMTQESNHTPIPVRINEIMYSIKNNKELDDVQKIFLAYQEIYSNNISTILSVESMTKINNFINRLKTYHDIKEAGKLSAEYQIRIYA